MKYRTIVADPPWKIMGGPLRGLGRHFQADAQPSSHPLPYPTMSVDEIAALCIPAEDDAHLYLWTINHYVEDAYRVARVWGFKPSTLIVWAKNPMGGGLGGAWGISTEYVLFARRGTLKHTGRLTGTWFNWRRPYGVKGPQHSAKPEGFYDCVEQVSPGPYLELFARRHRLGWDVWGDEVTPDVELVEV